MVQNLSSAKTSRNQIPAGFKQIQFEKGVVNLDWGGGKYTKSTEYLKNIGVKNFIYDPFNQSQKENEIALACNPDSITCFNVLNVIDCNSTITNLLIEISSYDVQSYFMVYEGDKTGIEKVTKNGYQRNLKTDVYILLLKIVFRYVDTVGKLLIASNNPIIY